MKASKFDMIFSKLGSVLFVVVLFVLNAIFKWGIQWKEIIGVGAFIFIVGLPISVSFWIQGIEAVIKAKTGVQIPYRTSGYVADPNAKPVTVASTTTNATQGQVG